MPSCERASSWHELLLVPLAGDVIRDGRHTLRAALQTHPLSHAGIHGILRASSTPEEARQPTPNPKMPSPRRAFLHLLACLSISLGAALSGVWTLGPRQRRGIRRLEIDLDLERMGAQIRIFSAWFRRSKRRPRFSRREWILILEYGERWGLSAAEISREFLVSQASVHRRRKHRREGLLATPPKKTVPPCQRICDDRRLLVADLAVSAFEHDRTIARHIELQGEKISARSVGRFRENPLGPAKPPEKAKRIRIKEAPGLPGGLRHRARAARPLGAPRVARLLRTLADAFTEGIAADTLRRLEQDALDDADERALLRTRRTQQLVILHARFRRIPPHKRPHYTDAECAEILALKYRFRLSNQNTGRWFLLDPSTLSGWNRDVDYPELRPVPLVQPLADIQTALASVAEALPPVPRRLKEKVAETLAILARAVPKRKRRTRPNKQRNKSAAVAARPRNSCLSAPTTPTTTGAPTSRSSRWAGASTSSPSSTSTPET